MKKGCVKIDEKQIFLAVLLAAAATLSLNGHAVYAASQSQLLGTITEGVHFSESVHPYDGGLLIANYGDIGYDAGTLYLSDLLHNQILELAVR